MEYILLFNMSMISKAIAAIRGKNDDRIFQIALFLK